MASKAKRIKSAKKAPRRVAGPTARASAGSALKTAAGMAVSALTGGGGSKGGGGGRRRRRGPEYWAKRVLVERLKKRYWRVKYGSK